MSKHYCPNCGGELLSSLFMGGWERVECPACKQWIDADVAAPESIHQQNDIDDRCHDNDVDDDPPGNRLDEYRDGERLVIHIARGSNDLVRSFGGVLLLIAVMLAYFTYDSLFAGGNNSFDALIVLGVAWMIVAPMAAAWIYAFFGSTSVMVEPGRLVVENRIFGMLTQKEYRLGLHSRATLVAAHRIWGNLVYGVRIGALGEKPVFATWLLLGEKRWIARRINRHLRLPDWEETEMDDNAEIKWSLMDGFQWGGD